MWERSEKHLVLGLLFANMIPHLAGLSLAFCLLMAGTHSLVALYHSFKEHK